MSEAGGSTTCASQLAELGHEIGTPLRVGGIPASELASRFGTPVYVYDAEVMRRRLRSVRSALGDRVDVSYAVKANPNIAVVSEFQRAGAGAEVASAGEIHAAFAAGYSGDRVQFAGPGKSIDEIELAVRQGLCRLNIESASEYDVVAEVCRRLGVSQGVAIRVNPDAALSGSRMHMGGGSQKFGVDTDQLEALLKRIVAEGVVDLRGLHVYAGTQAFDADAWADNARGLVAVADDMEPHIGASLRELNFGGGFGIAYYEGDQAFDLERAGAGIRDLIARDGRRDRSYHVELGRFLVASSGVYLTRVIRTKSSRGHTIALLDGGMHHHAAAAGMGSIMRRTFPIVACDQVSLGGAEFHYALCGPLCTPADEFSGDVEFSAEVLPGDLIAILASGAYGLSFSNVMFLSHPIPAEVVVDNGIAYEVRVRGTPKDWLRGQRLTEHS